MAPLKSLAGVALVASAPCATEAFAPQPARGKIRGVAVPTGLCTLPSPLLKPGTSVTDEGSSFEGGRAMEATGDDDACLERLCELFHASPGDNLRLSAGGERGVCLRRPVEEGDVILSIPLSSCFRDDEPPSWYEGGGQEGYDATNEEHDITDFERYGPSAWASRLAASLLDLELRQGGDLDEEDDLAKGREIWHSMLPDKNILRASLPVHWGEEVLATGKCTALELAVDSAYFSRAGAVTDLSEELRGAMENFTRSGSNNLDAKGSEADILQQKAELDAVEVALDMGRLQRRCHDALDIVQTRSCRVERKCEDGVLWGPPLRILAPIFDFINHGSSRDLSAEGAANACFGVENESMCDTHDAHLVVRALRDVSADEEVLIDYGDSARPAWRCLTSYGFVPEYDVDSEAEEVGGNPENVAELWMNGLRFDVDPASVPFDLVEVAAAQAMFDGAELVDGDHGAELSSDYDGGATLTPPVARAIARRATAASFNLVTEPEAAASEEDWDSPALVTAASLAALLRWSQHRVLLAFAENLELFAGSMSSTPSSPEKAG